MNNTDLQPWIGLDSYDEHHSEIFYGRALEIKEILSRISYNSHIVVYGPSGIGKSSVIKAGIFPKVRENYFLPIYIRLNHNTETSYTEQVIKTTKEELKKNSADIERNLRITDSDENSLWEFFQSNNFWSVDNFPLTPLIVFDQFEEIFTLASNKKRVDSFFEQLSDLVNNYIPKYVRNFISEQETFIRFPDDINYKVMVILREDFLAKLEEYDAKYPSLRKNRYSLQAINEEQAKDIILKPGGDLVDIDVAKRIIKKITSDAEFEFDDIPEITVEPALLSLFCTELNKKRISKKEDKISINLINESGDDIIKEFYEREIALVDNKTIEFLEDKLLTKSGFRDSVPVDDALEYGISVNDLKSLENGRIIRITERYGLRRIEYSHDILCKVAKENKENRTIEQEKARIRRKGMVNTITISLLLLFLTISTVFIYLMYIKEYVQYSSILIKQNGFLKGIDDLDKEEAAHKTFYYRLSKKGYKGPYTQVEAYDGYGNLTTDHGISTLLLDQWDIDDSGANLVAKKKIKDMCKWRFVKGKNNEILREEAFDRNDSLIWSFTYTKKIKAGNKSFVYGRFTDDQQLPFVQREKGISNIRISYDDDGNEELYEYYDNDGHPAKNSWNAFGEERKYYPNGLLKKQTSLDEFGEPMTDRAGNTGQIFEYNDKGYLIKSTSFDEAGKIKKVNKGFAIVRYEYDGEYGNLTKVLFFDENNSPGKYENKYYGYENSYNEKGKMIKNTLLGEDGESPIKNYLIAEYKYDLNGNRTAEEYFDTSGHYANSSRGNATKASVYNGEKLVDVKKFKYEKTEDTLKLIYHYKAWLNNKKQEILRFWFDPAYKYVSYFEKSTYNEDGEKTSLATYEFPGKYNELNLDDENFWDKNAKRMLSVNNQRGELFLYHKWIDSIDYRDTVSVLRTFIDSTNSVRQYMETKKYQGKQISKEYLDADRNFLSGTLLSHNLAGNISAISYIGISGNPYRNPFYKYSAYKLKYSLDDKGNVLDYAGYNEYGERSYARYYSNISKKYYVFHKYDRNTKKYYDLEGSQILNMGGFMNSLNYLYFFYLKPETRQEAKDKVRDGDIIIGYGNWRYNGENISDLNNEYKKLANSNKKIILLRLPEEKLIEFDSPPANFSLGNDFFYLTDREHKRILDILADKNL